MICRPFEPTLSLETCQAVLLALAVRPVPTCPNPMPTHHPHAKTTFPSATPLQAAKSLGSTLRAFQPTIRELTQVSAELKSTLESEIGINEIKEELRRPVSPTPAEPGAAAGAQVCGVSRSGLGCEGRAAGLPGSCRGCGAPLGLCGCTVQAVFHCTARAGS